jgi:O-antigen ligase
LLWLLLIAPIFFFQGRTIWLGICGILLWLAGLERLKRMWPAIAMALFCLLVGYLFLLPAACAPGDPVCFARLISPVRLEQNMQALEIFQESPLVGHGLNSFMIELRNPIHFSPDLEIDNPPGLLPGILVDGGLLGLAGLLLSGYYYFQGIPSTWSARRRLIYLLPVAFLPAFLTGQQLVLPEVAALCAIPVFARTRPGGKSASLLCALLISHQILFLLRFL